MNAIESAQQTQELRPTLSDQVSEPIAHDLVGRHFGFLILKPSSSRFLKCASLTLELRNDQNQHQGSRIVVHVSGSSCEIGKQAEDTDANNESLIGFRGHSASYVLENARSLRRIIK